MGTSSRALCRVSHVPSLHSQPPSFMLQDLEIALGPSSCTQHNQRCTGETTENSGHRPGRQRWRKKDHSIIQFINHHHNPHCQSRSNRSTVIKQAPQVGNTEVWAQRGVSASQTQGKANLPSACHSACSFWTCRSRLFLGNFP